MSRDDLGLLRLAASRDADGAPFLGKHHVAAGERLAALVERARLGPRLTMSYDAARVGGRRGAQNGVGEMTDSAAHARQQLNQLAKSLPTDCWNVLFDVCGMGKGLQLIETERRWPRRSAKLVLRIGLEQLAERFGLAPHQAGWQGGATRGWLDERLPLIAETGP